MNIVLTGPMGVGKTTVGMQVAKKLNMEFLDIDHLIEDSTGQSIGDIFEKDGVLHFRKLEAAMVSDVSQKEDAIIATGGGVVLNPYSMEELKSNGIIINLKASLDVLLRRLDRREPLPILQGEDMEPFMKRYMAEREELYKVADHTIDTDGISVDEIVDQILKIAREGAV